MPHQLPNRLRRLCRIMSFIAALGVALLVATSLFFLIFPDQFNLNGEAQVPISGLQHGLLMMLLLIMLAPGAFGLWHVRRLLKNYASGEVLTLENARTIRLIGVAVLCGVALSIVGRTVFVLILTMRNPPGEKMLSVSLSSHDYFYLLLGALLFVMGWVMSEASRQADENRQFV